MLRAARLPVGHYVKRQLIVPLREYSWEEDCAKEYRLFDDEYEEPILLRQDYVDANEIVCDFCGNLDNPGFPWHRHTEEDYINLNCKLQQRIAEIKVCKDATSAKKFIAENTEIYEAYLRWPIQVQESDGRYHMMNDGRHRIWAARRSNGILPVRVVEYRRIHSMSVAEYTACRLHDDWFYDLEK